MDKPQIICLVEKSLPFTLYDALFIPSSAKFVVLGSQPRGTGVINIYELHEGDIHLVKTVSRPNLYKLHYIPKVVMESDAD